MRTFTLAHGLISQMTDLPDFLKQGEAARLFPVLSTTSKKQGNIHTSWLHDKVDEFAAELLKTLGLGLESEQ